jgi:hypothetical protein
MEEHLDSVERFNWSELYLGELQIRNRPWETYLAYSTYLMILVFKLESKFCLFRLKNIKVQIFSDKQKSFQDFGEFRSHLISNHLWIFRHWLLVYFCASLRRSVVRKHFEVLLNSEWPEPLLTDDQILRRHLTRPSIHFNNTDR